MVMKNVASLLFVSMIMSLMLSFASCNKNNVKTVELDNSFAVSLFSDTIELEKMLNMIDPAVAKWIKISPDGELYANYSDSLKNAVVGDDILSGIDDFTFDSNSEIELPNIPASPVPVPLNYTFEDLLAVPFAFEGYSINSVLLKSGKFSMELNTDLPVLDKIELKTKNIKLSDGSDLTVALDIKNNDTNIDINLEQCRIFPENGEIKFSASLSATISDEPIGGDYKFFLKGGMKDLKFESIDGAIEDMVFDFAGSHDISFGINNLSGDFTISKPIIDIRYVNTFGFESSCVVDTLCLSTTSDSDISLIKDWNQFEITLKTTDESAESAADFSGQIVNEINILNDYNQLRFSGNVVMGCKDLQGDMISNDSHIDLIANVMMPMEFSMNELRYLDTIDFDISMGEDNTENFIFENPFDELEFKFVISNELPIKVIPQLYFVENGVVIDSIFTNEACINASLDGKATEDVLIVSVVDDKIENVLSADKLIMDLRFSTEGNMVMMNVKDNIKIRLGLKTKTTEITF